MGRNSEMRVEIDWKWSQVRTIIFKNKCSHLLTSLGIFGNNF